MRKVDVVIVGGSLSAAGAAKRCHDAGLETLVLERKKLPRHKICSGILSPRGHQFMRDNFGEIPDEALHTPRLCKGVNFLYPDGSQMPMDFVGGATPHLHRRFSDCWAVKSSGAEIHDETEVIGFEDKGHKVVIEAKNKAGEPLTYECKYMIGADGPRSMVVNTLYPGYREKLKWFVVMQQFYKATVDLDENYFHFFIDDTLGHYPWSHLQSGEWIVGVGGFLQDDIKNRHAKVLDAMVERHGFKVTEVLRKEGCPENFGLSLTNRYEFGKGRVLVTGQAAGFLNMMAEGMSCAMHSGAHAGESVVHVLKGYGEIERVYRDRVQDEVKRCTDQWNPLKIVFDKPHEADLMKGLFSKGPLKAAYWSKEMIKFCKQFHGLGWGVDIMKATKRRVFSGSYGDPFPLPETTTKS